MQQRWFLRKQQKGRNEVPVTKAAALYRVSTKRQVKDEEDNIPMQQHIVRAYAARNGLELPEELEYIEPGISAYKISSTNRDILQDVLADAAKGKFSKLLLFKHDRLSRKSFEYPQILKTLYDLGVEVIDVSSGTVLNVTDQMNKLIRFIEGWQAETESTNTSIRVSAAMVDRARAGHWSGGRPPYGFQLSDNKNSLPLVINDKEAHVLKEMVRLYLENDWGSKKIAGYLNEKGYRTRENRLWRDSSVRRVLQNPIIAGLPAYNRTKAGNTPNSRVRIKNWCDIDNPEIIIPRDDSGNPLPVKEYSIIPLPTWRRVIDIMVSRSQNSQLDNRAIESTALLTGFLKCGYCGKGFISSKQNNAKTIKPNGKVYTYKKASYRCITHARIGSAYCDGQGTYSQNKIDKIFMNELEKFLGNIDLGNLEQYVEIKQASRTSGLKKQIQHLEKDLKRVQRRLSSWVERLNDYFSDPNSSIYSEDLLAKEVKKAEQDAVEIKKHIVELTAELEQSTLGHDNLIHFSRLAPRWFDIFKDVSVQKQKEMLSQIIDKVILWRDRMEIIYNINLIELSKTTGGEMPERERQVHLKIAVDI